MNCKDDSADHPRVVHAGDDRYPVSENAEGIGGGIRTDLAGTLAEGASLAARVVRRDGRRIVPDLSERIATLRIVGAGGGGRGGRSVAFGGGAAAAGGGITAAGGRTIAPERRSIATGGEAIAAGAGTVAVGRIAPGGGSGAAGGLHVLHDGRAWSVTLPGHAVADGDADAVLTRVTAPLPGKVVKTTVRGGERVERGATLVVLEAMKMDLSVEALRAGVVEAVSVPEGEPVAEGALLVTFSDAGADAGADAGTGDPPE